MCFLPIQIYKYFLWLIFTAFVVLDLISEFVKHIEHNFNPSHKSYGISANRI